MIATSPVAHELIVKAARRIGVRGALNGVAVGGAIAAVWTLISLANADVALLPAARATRWIGSLVVIAIGGMIGWWRTASARHNAAAELEQRVPHAQNLLITANELSRPSHGQQPTSGVAALVQKRADELAASIDVSTLLPLRRSLQRVGLAALALAAVLLSERSASASANIPRLATLVASAVGRVDVQRVAVRIVSPRYTQRTDTSLRDPSRIDVLAGSVMTFAINASADTLIAVTGQGTRVLAPTSNGAFTLTIPATQDGFVSFEPRSTRAAAGPRRLIGLTVRSDEAPRARIIAPARDLVVPDANRTLDIRLEADDDLALGSLRLRYTKVSGSGERFEFVEGEVPVSIARANAAQWSARASLALGSLLQEPGDLVVYRAVTTDTRPGSLAVESDAYIAELAAPGGVAALGFSLDPDEERYALSQQMVILKTEKLIAARSTMSAPALADAAAQLAGEQRRVRAEFVFMMGGEFAQEVTGDVGSDDLDETHEAESEGDIAAGRMANRGRTALLAAVRAMSRAAVALTVANLAPALASEKAALRQLQEAFARQRFLMRALSEREQLDPTRRLTGRLDSTARGRANIPDGERDTRRIAWRQVLADVTTLSRSTARDAATYAELAERVLRIDASTPAVQRLSAQLIAAGAARGSSATRSRALLDSVAVSLTALQRDGMRPAAAAAAPIEMRRLQADLDAALRSATATPRDAARGSAPPRNQR